LSLPDGNQRSSGRDSENLEFGQWNTVINDNRSTAGLIDRLVHHGHVLAFTGESHRLRNALSQPNAPRKPDGTGFQRETLNPMT
jgi:hypothetical protein